MLKNLARLMLIICVPLILTMLFVRLLTLPWYPTWQYSRDSFPPDPLSMSDGERVRLAKLCIRFLNVPHNRSLLADARFDNGDVAFIERELDHMDDVKEVYDTLTWLVAGLAVVAMACKWWLYRQDRALVWATISTAGIVTLVILGVLGIWMLTGFSEFFTAFHGVFFAEGTWIFYYDDTLIRLFPLELWRDAGLIIAGAVASSALVLAVVGHFRARALRVNV